MKSKEIKLYLAEKKKNERKKITMYRSTKRFCNEIHNLKAICTHVLLPFEKHSDRDLWNLSLYQGKCRFLLCAVLLVLSFFSVVLYLFALFSLKVILASFFLLSAVTWAYLSTIARPQLDFVVFSLYFVANGVVIAFYYRTVLFSSFFALFKPRT